MRVAIATDAWHPQVNGVVRSLEATTNELRRLDVDVRMITAEGFRSVAMPSYPGIRLALARPGAIAGRLAAIAPDHVHIATEGPIGLATRHACLRERRPFTTSYHTHFPDYIAARLPIPRRLSYRALRWFHSGGRGVMVATDSLAADLRARGFDRLMRWSRGVDADQYRPRTTSVLDLPRPIFLYVGRVAVEKNVEALLRLSLPGSTVIVGDGPAREELESRYPHATFLGTRTGDLLAETYASADVFVFPSRTDTFGIVLLEALASGLPVAAYPVPGPSDVLGTSSAGALDEDLAAACARALLIPKTAARTHALRFTWRESAKQFLDNIYRVHAADPLSTLSRAAAR
jgi:glycosyltransferase involved in cell wall biosynthesis